MTTLTNQFNLRSPAVKRLMKEAAELSEPTEEYSAQPLENNLFEWHFTVKGPPDSDFSNGYYHGRILLPTEYPMKPPSIILLTPNGRFEINKKICLSISGHHPESWQPSWSIRTALLAIIGFMPTESLGAIGGLDYSSEERQALAVKSQSWSCSCCGPIKSLLRERTETSEDGDSNENREAHELAKQIRFKELEIDTGPGKHSKHPQPGSSKGNDGSNVNNTETRHRKVGFVNLDHSNRDSRHQTSNTSSVGSSLESSSVESRTRSSTYLMIFLSLAITFLLFRRIFLSEQ